MSRCPRPIQLIIALPPSDYRVYVAAARLLARIMGAQAPSVAVLIETQLSHHDPTGVADDYLDLIGWPLAKGRVVSLRRRGRKRVLVRSTAVRRRTLRFASQRLDPSRN